MQQQFFDTIGPGDEDLYQQAVRQPLDFKIRQAIALLKLWEPPEGYYLAYSGGKDSGAILQLAKMAGVKFEAWYNVTTIDPPELVRFIQRQGNAIGWNRPKMSLFAMMVNQGKGPPTRLMRWCCERYKEHGGVGRTKVIGVRGEESRARKGRWKQVTYHTQSKKPIICPILYWTDADIWSFHAQENLPYCELYDQGFKRLGCVGCPMSGPKGVARDFARWPRYEIAWKRAVRRFWIKWHDIPTNKGGVRWFEDLKSWDGLWDWWISQKAKEAETEEECQGQSLFK
jgi:phosphoadenosine phosphosulfate reductase